MDQSIAVAIVHGTGRKEPDFAADIIETLHVRFPTHLTDEATDQADLVIEPVYWADITRQIEDQVWEKVTQASSSMDHLELRRFIFNVTGDTLALLVTYGSPIAIWRLRFGDDYKAIRFPGEAVEELYANLEAKWLNIYDADDVLGYPISLLTERYEDMAEAGYLEDRERNVGSIFKSWNPLSHKGYLRDKDSLDDLAGFIADIWQGACFPMTRSSHCAAANE